LRPDRTGASKSVVDRPFCTHIDPIGAAVSTGVGHADGFVERSEATRVFNFGDGFEPEQTHGAEVGVDFDVEFAVTQKFRVAVGGNNVLDEYPDLSSSDINFIGNLPYDVLQPLTLNGAFFYMRTTYTF